MDAIRRDLADAPLERAAARRRAELAVLVGDGDAARRQAEVAVRDGIGGYVAGFREYLATLLALIAEDDAHAARNLDGLIGFVSGHDELRSGHPSAIVDIPRGLLARDAERVAGGVDALLAWHLRRARSRSDIFNSSSAVVSLDSVVALLLAHRRGLSVPVPAAYRAAQVPLLVLYVNEWRGEPLPPAMPIGRVTDLVAGEWLTAQGLELAPPPRSPTAPRSLAKQGSRGPAVVSDDVARRSLRLREEAGGSAWQLASWALMLGDADRARAHLRHAAEQARLRWRQSASPRTGVGWLRQAQGMPNHNLVREHFALALVLGDQAAIAETAARLDVWATAAEEDQRRRGQPPHPEGRQSERS